MKTAGQLQMTTEQGIKHAPALSLFGGRLATTFGQQMMCTLRQITGKGSKAFQAIACMRPIVLCPIFATPIKLHESSTNNFYRTDWTHVNIRGGNP